VDVYIEWRAWLLDFVFVGFLDFVGVELGGESCGRYLR